MNMESELGKIVEAFDQKVGPDQASGGLKLTVFGLHRPSGDVLTDDAPDRKIYGYPK